VSDADAESEGYETYHFFYVYAEMGMGSAVLVLSVNEIENGAVYEVTESGRREFASYRHGGRGQNVPSLIL